ncbi:MAG: hypothetical protein A3I77_03260 [Gammaproteobacteria bacterium RIFCSPLOWO2_02_FULL_42_14]|nr:MAG: hypothetical protein A3B71_01240 [Gammaproteobacteria bacterium RIFCSPHIGHO2_02_FULL_42_43]OGT28038.1 MAG: hypothetical protein A2624_02440 [Gammaproteobacteria bacterium RIFCSPHIGHO2_01_FULL_42_8]OGT51691.1 MAG: hypothetical protein A3E54_03455 [Gammaproteobacteria bacterium RIFCSPHIGHO2_12_FULL_41_25]OGT61588.1 MAG: hypothetical protein A3I77_03260 [Gammaproteobacteria bacterium RIFCSPLOWO2_02_FULL_42_14]OGT86212.1 MAG: hypothetical protein A3G86_06110 [Gammaproteobacteria bacterium R
MRTDSLGLWGTLTDDKELTDALNALYTAVFASTKINEKFEVISSLLVEIIVLLELKIQQSPQLSRQSTFLLKKLQIISEIGTLRRPISPTSQGIPTEIVSALRNLFLNMQRRQDTFWEINAKNAEIKELLKHPQKPSYLSPLPPPPYFFPLPPYEKAPKTSSDNDPQRIIRPPSPI